MMVFARFRRLRFPTRFGALVVLTATLVGCAVSPLQPNIAQSSGAASAGPAARRTPTAQKSAASSARPAASSLPLSAQPAATADATTVVSSTLTQIKGSFSYSNNLITDYYVEYAVALADMYGFVTRDLEWEAPVEGQTLGFLKVDTEQKRGDYTLQLPARPRGTPVDVDNDGQPDAGVQIFVVAFSPNVTGGPFAEGDDRSTGWPSFLASTINDPENDDEVTGGKLIVWTPDASQQFPTDFGPDRRLFTTDDPVAPLPAGYTVIDLDQAPFGVSQTEQPDIALNEPADFGVKDYSTLSYSEAWSQLLARARQEYAFNGIPGKEPNWNELEAQLSPRIAEAERARDPQAFYAALNDFANAFRDGHVGLNSDQFAGELFRAAAIGGYGLNVRELDDKRVIVSNVVADGPAAKAGIQKGAQVTRWNDQPVADAISAVKPFGGPFSTDFALRYQQQAFLVRAPVGTAAKLTYTNPGGSEQTTSLRASDELESYYFASPYKNLDSNVLPVEFRLLESGVGYVKINSNYDDLNLIIRLFERALSTFEQNDAPGIIIDMRTNLGGANLGLAGFLTDQEIPLAQLQYYSNETGQFEPEGLPDKVRPNQRQFRFDKIALLVDQACASACELESYGFSQVPGAIVIGQYPTAGVEAEVARGQFKLPEDITLQIPTGRFVLPDGSIFLEGKGVQPTQRVPIDEKTVLSDQDVVLQAAESAILNR